MTELYEQDYGGASRARTGAGEVQRAVKAANAFHAAVRSLEPEPLLKQPLPQTDD